MLEFLAQSDADVAMFEQVTFLVTHFSDARIANSDVRDILLQSISVLVQYKEHVIAFERSPAAREGMVGSLLASFDNRFWIPVSNILLRLCKGSGFGASKCLSHGESFSPHFQVGEVVECQPNECRVTSLELVLCSGCLASRSVRDE